MENTIPNSSEHSLDLYSPFTHIVDWNMVQTIEDIKEILKSFDIKFNPHNINENVKKYLTPIQNK